MGATYDCCSKLRVSTVCGRSLSHSFIGNVSSTLVSTALKWFLKFVLLVPLHFFDDCLVALTDNSNSFSSFYTANASLSSMCVVGLTVPDAVSRAHKAR